MNKEWMAEEGWERMDDEKWERMKKREKKRYARDKDKGRVTKEDSKRWFHSVQILGACLRKRALASCDKARLPRTKRDRFEGTRAVFCQCPAGSYFFLFDFEPPSLHVEQDSSPQPYTPL